MKIVANIITYKIKYFTTYLYLLLFMGDRVFYFFSPMPKEAINYLIIRLLKGYR